MDDPLQGFKPVDDWPIVCRDRWPPGTLRASAKEAYDCLARRGELLADSIRRQADGSMVVVYRSQIPQEWMRDRLRQVEQR